MLRRGLRRHLYRCARLLFRPRLTRCWRAAWLVLLGCLYLALLHPLLLMVVRHRLL